jgi:hypothetical protein
MKPNILNTIETLCFELRAIGFWDAAFWRDQKPDEIEMAAFCAREERQGEIIREMLILSRSYLGVRTRRKKNPRSYIQRPVD